MLKINIDLVLKHLGKVKMKYYVKSDKYFSVK